MIILILLPLWCKKGEYNYIYVHLCVRVGFGGGDSGLRGGQRSCSNVAARLHGGNSRSVAGRDHHPQVDARLGAGDNANHSLHWTPREAHTFAQSSARHGKVKY